MMSVNEMRKRLKPMNLKMVSREAGVSYGAVRRLSQEDSKPSYETARKVAAWLESRA